MRPAPPRAMDQGVGPAHPARATHLPSQALVPTVQRPQGVRLLSVGRRRREKPSAEAIENGCGSGNASAQGETMTREAFRALVEEAIDTIPRRFAREIRNVAIVIEDEPSAALLEEMEIVPPDTLLGLYQGTPLTERQWGHGNDLPDRITLFQSSIEEDADGDEDEIVIAIGETLIHELGHYFGLSEEEIMEIEERYWQGESVDDEA